MFIEKVLEGLAWGSFIVAIMASVAIFSIVWHWLGPIVKPKRKKDEEVFLSKLFEDPPELPTNEEQPPTYRFVPSTIVRPPHVIRLGDDKDEE